ncbi:MAG: tetratricopeptide repeat protein [Phycisphaeraceae bacterium]
MTTRSRCFALLSACLVCLVGFGCATTAPNPSTATTGVDEPPAATQPLVRGDKDSAYGVGGTAQLFPDMGDYRRPVTTDAPLAQRYFNQGLKWIYAFNHDEAVRSFTKATEIDPTCAMAWWGIAYAQGPNYNASNLNPARRAAAWDAIQRAIAELDRETPAEQALVRATALRTVEPAVFDRLEGEAKKLAPKQAKAAFAKAMAKVWADHPDDADLGTLYADAMMLNNPWRLFKSDGTPARAETLDIIQTLEAVMRFAPMHPGANHLYVHAVEAGRDKQRGVAAADRLSTLVPMSGHLTHMPSHIYVQAGLWERAIDQNLIALKTDRAYLERSPAHFRQHGYIAHNGHMLAFAAMMVGREEDAMRGAMHAWNTIPDDLMDTMGRRYDRALCARLDVMKRFGRWDQILAEPKPPEMLRLTTAVWHMCRAVAFAAKKDFDNAAIDQAIFKQLRAKRQKDKLLRLYDHFIAAEIALHKEQWSRSIDELQKAIAIEDTLGYGEPPRHLQPVRHTLGAVYAQVGDYANAERVYREDLDKWPGNGWSLFGLARALNEQGKTDEADQALAAYQDAWRHADQPLRTSCKCIPKL